ncbi:hypothetical protein AURDEDRAFT_171128 [Auricularia subglabra TFB-10046 SS5]|nr:hypothetical protein AURDEDRAFT_171128 [Auricularia subglabra TFB-10046 SS5]
MREPQEPDPLELGDELFDLSQWDEVPDTQVLVEELEQRSNSTSMVSAASADTIEDNPVESKPGDAAPSKGLVQRDSNKTLVNGDENAPPMDTASSSKSSVKRKQESPSPVDTVKRARAETVAPKGTPVAGKRKAADLSEDDGKPPPGKKTKKKAAGSDDEPTSSKKRAKTQPKGKAGKKARDSLGGKQQLINHMLRPKSVDTARSLSETPAVEDPPQPPDNTVAASGPAVLMPKATAPPSMETWNVGKFRRKSLVDSRPFFVAHSEKHLRALARAPFGVVWAASRHADTLEKLPVDAMSAVKMCNNVEGVKSLLEVLKCTNDLNAFPLSVLEEADIEARALAVNRTAGFGGDASKGVVAGAKHWYGGKVQYCLSIRARDKPDESGEKYCAVFMPLELGPSCRFSRHGSDNWIPVSISNKTFGTQKPEEWTEFFARPFVIMGRVYHAVYSKEQTKRFLYRSRLVLPQHTALNIAVPDNAMDFIEFADQHNPFAQNCQQSMQKWIARFALGTSNSVPICQFKPGNINLIDDLYANGKTKATAASHEIMTDGWGYMNRAGFNLVHEKLELKERYSAIQFRLAGAKGVLVEAVDSMDGAGDPKEPRVWLRASQIKIQYPALEPREHQPLDVARLILEHLRPARIKTPSRISALSIINLDSNAYTTDEMKKMHPADQDPKSMRQIILKNFTSKLKEDYASLIMWDTCETRVRVAHTVDALCAVTAMRRARDLGATSRAKGLWYRERKGDEDGAAAPGVPADIDGDEDDEDEYEDAEEDLSGTAPAPGTVASTDHGDAQEYLTPAAMALRMLFSGFDPVTCPILRSHIRTVLRTSTEQYLKKFRVEITMSAEAMIISDTSLVLGENEIFLSSSKVLLDNSGRTMNHLSGDVLVYRNPVRLPCDIQKVKAVYKPELDHYRDVIVFSAKGTRSLASKLAGGDYDGDTAVVIWDQDIVRLFNHTKDCAWAMDPSAAFKEKNFVTRTQPMKEFLQRRPLERHDLLLITHSACDDRQKVGQYSKLHESNEYRLGLSAHVTVETAHKFNIILDGAKNGDQIKPEVFTEDQRRAGDRHPNYKLLSGKAKGDCAHRSLDSQEMHVLDYLWTRGTQYVNEMLRHYEHVAASPRPDLTLASDWHDFERIVSASPDPTKPVLLDIRDCIIRFCDDLRDRYYDSSRLIARTMDKEAACVPLISKEKAAANYAKAREDRMAIRRDFLRGPLLRSVLYPSSTIRTWLASCLFYIDAVRPETDSHRAPDSEAKCAFNVAFTELCEMKASRSGVRYQSVLEPFLNHMPPRVRD